MRTCIYPLSSRSICVAITLLSLSFMTASPAQRLSSRVVPTHYALQLTPDLKSATFTGEETIDITLNEPAREIKLNAAEMVFQSAAIVSNGQQQSASVSLDAKKEQATLAFPAPVLAGKATLKIRYSGILNNELRGFYLSKTARRNYAVTQFESTDARRAFPCFDEPAFKATFDVSLTIDAGDMAISNTPILSDTPGPAAGKHTLAFATTPKMSTYLVAFLVGDFQCTSAQQDGVAIRVCATPGEVEHTEFALDTAKYALHYYDEYFGIHYPLKKLDLIGIPDFEAGAMENFGAITFRESDLLLDPKTATIDSKENVALVVAHEMAHQWFGDLVTMQWWDNVWLNEGFATWMESKPIAQMHPEWGMQQAVASEEQQTLNIDAQPTTRAIRAKADTPEEIEQMFDGIAYGKASDVLLMVENYVGAESFRKGVHNYLAAHEYANATAEDFWNAQTAVSHKPVDKIMSSLVAQPGAPILTFGTPANGRIPVEQKRFFLSPGITPNPAQKWTLPVCFKTADAQQCELLTPETTSLAVPAGSPIFANAGGVGYYRNAYPAEQYAAIAAQAASALTPSERIALIGDEWAQVRANKARIGDYLDLMAALTSDPSDEVVSQATAPLGSIDRELASTQQERDALGAWVSRSFAPVYAKLGAPAPGDSPNSRQLRADLFSLLAHYGNDSALLAQARQLADQYLADPTSVDPTLGQAALEIAAQHGDASLFDRMVNAYETSHDPGLHERALRLLVAFEDPALLGRALDYVISSKVRNQDAAYELAIAVQSDKTRDQAWSFVQSHWEQIKTELTPELGAALVGSTGSFCTAETRDQVQNFFAAHPVSAADVALKHAIEHIDGCMEFRRLQEPNLKAWLAAHPAN